MCQAAYTESGKFLGMEYPCPEYRKLEDDLFSTKVILDYYKRMFTQMQDGCDGGCAPDECVCGEHQRILDLKDALAELQRERDALYLIASSVMPESLLNKTLEEARNGN